MTIQTIPRRLPEVGRLRLGQRLPAGNGTRPAALAAWRLTSKSRFRLEAAAQVYGGTVQEWKDAPGEDPQWELFTESKALRVAVIPTQPVSQFYEHWSAGGCQRRCDGATELISGDACLCQMEADEPSDYRCKPTTRLSVLLPDLPGLGVWRVETHGYYGAAELAASAELLAGFGRPMPVALVIDQRSEKRPGQPRRDYVVPMLDSRQSFLDLQALAAADPVTGELSSVGRPALQSSGTGSSANAAEDPANASPVPGQTSGAGPATPAARVQPAPDPKSPPSPTDPEVAPTEADRSGAEGAHVDGRSERDVNPPTDAASTPPGAADDHPPGRRPPGGTNRAGRGGRARESTAAPAGTEEAEQAAFEQGLAEGDPGRFAR
jgi:hypothetical protein